MRARGWLVAGAVLSALALSACGGSVSDEAGFGLGDLSEDDSADVFASAGVSPAAMSGRLVVKQNGCFTWSGEEADGAWIVWPKSARLDPESGDRVVLHGGASVGDGADLDGTGALVALEDLPGGSNPDSYFASFGTYCGADTQGVVVLTAVSSR